MPTVGRAGAAIRDLSNRYPIARTALLETRPEHDRHLRHDNELFDLAYALNKRLMAKQPSMWIPSHNPYLASALLAGAFIADDLSSTHEKGPLEA